jgi:epoxyqueuosine reductase
LRRSFAGLAFGCDICQDVCPWNSRAPATGEIAFAPRRDTPLERLAGIDEDEFDSAFSASPVLRARYTGFLRNVALAMGSAPRPEYRLALEKLACSTDPVVAGQARWSLKQLDNTAKCSED